MSMRYFVGLDIGTSSVKGVLMTAKGEICARAHESFLYIKGEGGVLEVEANSFLNSCLKAIKTLVDAACGGEVCGICAASASGNLVVLDKDMQPQTAVINWQDTRVTTEAREILGELDLDALYRKMGWPFDYEGLPLAQLCYIKKHNPAILENAGMVCMSTEFLYYALTGKWGITTSAATPFYLVDQVKGAYIPEILEKLGIDESILPPVMKASEVLGVTTEQIAEKAGIPAGIPVILGTFDHPSAARGVGVLEEGQLLLSCGTSWVGFFPVKSRDKIADAGTLIDPFLSDDGGCWATMVSVSSLSARIGAYVTRYVDNSNRAFKIFGQLAAKSELGAGGLTINPQEAFDDERIRKYPKEHIARAIMEGTIRLLKAELDGLKAHGITADSAIMVGGPSENPMWLTVIEELCGIPVKVIHGEVAGSVGAAMLAGIGVGEYKDIAHAQSICMPKE